MNYFNYFFTYLTWTVPLCPSSVWFMLRLLGAANPRTLLFLTEVDTESNPLLIQSQLDLMEFKKVSELN